MSISRYYLVLRNCVFITLGLGLSALPACNNTEKTEPVDSVVTGPAAINNDPRTADSITPVSLKDTALLSEYGKDSLKLCVAFQRTANEMCKTIKARDAVGYTKFTPPNVLQGIGGKSSFIMALSKGWSEEKSIVNRVVAGPIKRVAAAIDDEGYGHGWYCLMPVRRFVFENGQTVEELQWFGGQSLDFGKTCYFINVTGLDKESVAAVMPDLRFVLDQETLK